MNIFTATIVAAFIVATAGFATEETAPSTVQTVIVSVSGSAGILPTI